MISVHLYLFVKKLIVDLILKCKSCSKKSKDISRAKKIKAGSTSKNTTEQAKTTSKPKKRDQFEIASLPKTELLVIEEEDSEESESFS